MRKILCAIFVFFLSLSVLGCNQKPVGLVVGEPAPDFTLVDLKGQTWTLSDLKGQVVFINFWATWCPPCLKEMPSMQALFTTLPEEKFKMLAILNNDKMTMAEFIAGQKGLTMPILDDSENIVGSQYGLTGLPETFIVDKNGILREKFIGPELWNSPKHVQMLMKYINQ